MSQAGHVAKKGAQSSENRPKRERAAIIERMRTRYLTGITTTGSPHLGNYVGAIKPAVEFARVEQNDAFYFLADLHALIKADDPERIRRSTLEIAATWLALGLDPNHATFYRQSDVPEIPELTWVLACSTAKGLMNKAHAYKAAVDTNRDAQVDDDAGVTIGLYLYPVLMAADILAFRAQRVPVGRDQVQHLELCRDIAQRFNHRYGPVLELPEAVVDESTATLPGLDGRKMSKSYGNTIPLMLDEKALRKSINRIVTNLKAPGEAKGIDESGLYSIWCAFATSDERAWLASELGNGLAWGEAKRLLFEKINAEIAPARERYEALIARPAEVEDVLRSGAIRARETAREVLAKVRDAVGIGRLG
jgi:tryptophanyl-tRNA synthetase